MRNGYRLSISPEKRDEYKLVWGDPYADLQPYCVSGSRVGDASEEVRAVLDRICHHYRECEITKQTPQYSQFLSELAKAGEQLSQSLFDRSSGDKNSADEARQLTRSITNDRVPLSIMVSGTPLHVPWSFIYSGDSDALAAPVGTLADFAKFWTSIFDINVSFSRTRLFRSSSRGADEKYFLLHALHDKLFPEAMSSLPDDERKLIDNLIEYPLVNSTYLSACRKKWRSVGDKYIFIYLFGHSDGKSIFLNNANDSTSKPDATDSSRALQPADTESKTICFKMVV
jgi:hypothetical protein